MMNFFPTDLKNEIEIDHFNRLIYQLKKSQSEYLWNIDLNLIGEKGSKIVLLQQP